MAQQEIIVPSSEVPNGSRIYHYIIGGKYYNEVDKKASDYFCSLMPSLPKWLKMLHMVLAKAGAVFRYSF